MYKNKMDELFTKMMRLDEDHKSSLLARLFGMIEGPSTQNFKLRVLQMIENQVKNYEEQKNSSRSNVN